MTALLEALAWSAAILAMTVAGTYALCLHWYGGERR